MSRDQIYSVDSSAIIDGLERYYPEQQFPALWVRVDELIAAGRFVISDEVHDELQRKDEVARRWCETRKDAIVVPTDGEVVTAVRGILRDHPLLVKAMKGRSRADPFVIAVASVKDGTVVTGEGNDGTATRPKIPSVCGEMKIDCCRFLDLIRREGWSF